MRTVYNSPLKLLILSIFMFGLQFYCQSQIKIGFNNEQINAGSLLELEHPSKGLMFSSIQIDDTNVWGLDGDSPADGMVVFNSSTQNELGLYVWYNNRWNLLRSTDTNSGGSSDGYGRIKIFQNTTPSVDEDGNLLINDPDWDGNGTLEDNVYRTLDHVVFLNNNGEVYSTYAYDEITSAWQLITPFLPDRSTNRADQVFFSKDGGNTINEIDLDLSSYLIKSDASSEAVFRKALSSAYCTDDITGVKVSQLKGVSESEPDESITGDVVFCYPASWSHFSFFVESDVLGLIDVANGLEYETVKAGASSLDYPSFLAPNGEDYKVVTIFSNNLDVVIQ